MGLSWGCRRQDYYDYIETLLETAEAQHLEMDGCDTGGYGFLQPGRWKKLAPPPIPPLNCTHTMKGGPKKGRYCGKVSVRVEAGKSVCFHHTQRTIGNQRDRGRRYAAKKREMMTTGKAYEHHQLDDTNLRKLASLRKTF